MRNVSKSRAFGTPKTAWQRRLFASSRPIPCKSITDIPAQPKPEVRLYAVQVRRCRRCGRAVRGQHPDVAADQQGATAHRLGPRGKALGHVLHYQHGGPVRKPPARIEEMTRGRLTRGAPAQDALKT